MHSEPPAEIDSDITTEGDNLSNKRERGNKGPNLLEDTQIEILKNKALDVAQKI